MKAEEENKLEKNDLAESLKSIAEKAKAAKLSNVRFAVLLLVLGAVFGAWWYLRGSGRKSESQTWRQFESLAGADQYEKFAEAYVNTLPGRAAQLQQARLLLAQGILQLTSPAIDADGRKKTIEMVEKARELFDKLAGEFKDDLTLRAHALEGAAKAELALVGIPKSDGNLTDERGSVKKAAEYHREFAKVVGEATPLGEAAMKKAKELEDKEAEIKSLGASLNNQFSPKPAGEFKHPDGLTSPKNPLNPIEPIAPGKVDAPKSDPIPPPKVEPKKDEPKKDEPKKDEPKKVEPKKEETKPIPSIPPPPKAEPKKDEPKKEGK
jgi:hypothetical protein